MKTETAVEKTISQSEQQLQNTDVGPSLQDVASAATSSAEHRNPKPLSLHEHQQETENNPFGKPIPTNLLKKGGRM